MEKSLSEVLCEVCNSPAQFFSTRLSWDYYKCSRCKSVFLNPIPTNEQLEDLYVNQQEVQSSESKKLAKIVSEIVSLASDSTREYKILDIGSQNGDLLSLLQSINQFELFGVEPSKEGFLKSSQHPKLHIKNGFFSRSDYQPSSFHFVNLGDVIEHLEDPFSMIVNIREILRSQGYLIISTPVTDCPYVRTSDFLHSRLGSLFPAAYLTPPHHIRYFTSNSLDNLLLNEGFTKVKSWYSPSHFYYELASSQILLGFRSKTLIGNLNPIFLFKLSLFSSAYLFSRFLTLFTKKDFSYTAIYQLKS